MIYNLYSVRDKLVGFMVPTCDPNDLVAVRSFKSAVIRSRCERDERVNDLELYRVGEFDVDTGIITPCNPPFKLVDSSSVGGDEYDG